MEGRVSQVVEVPRERIRPFADQPRSYFDESALKDLARSLKAVGQQVPVTVKRLGSGGRHDYELIDGQRRWLAAGIAGIATLKALVSEAANEDDQFLASVVSNFAREGHTMMEIARAIARLRRRPEIKPLRRGDQTQHIADIFGRSIAWVLQMESLLRLISAAQDATHPRCEKRLTFQAAILLAQCAPEVQARLIGTFQNKHATANGMTLAIRRAAMGEKQPPAFAQPLRMRTRFLGNLSTAADTIEKLLDLRIADFARMFNGQPRAEQESALFRIERCIEQLQQLRQTVSRMLKKAA
jgi:ParB/RepB/Spo0J family partition protein